MTATRAGFVAIVGEPNVGKSTLLNAMLGEKLAPVSRRPQTTRGVVRGILTGKTSQIVFLDTPGHHRPYDRLGEWMQQEIEKALESADLVYWMVFPRLPSEADRKIAGLLGRSEKPVFLVVNQIDRVSKPELLPVLEAFAKLGSFREMIPVSAERREQIPLLLRKTEECLPAGEFLYPPDDISDQQQRFFVQELIREKIFRFTGQEVPHASGVLLEHFKDRSERLVDIRATIVVEKDSQKAILIGKGGEKMKQIGREARQSIEKFLGKKVFLELWVKAVPGWRKDPKMLKAMGCE
ncbi:MAG: GTPase Era [Candidatus Omnitrophota bacterium]